MAARDWDGRTDPDHKAGPGRKAVGYCCVFMAGCYVAAVILLVGYLIFVTFR